MPSTGTWPFASTSARRRSSILGVLLATVTMAAACGGSRHHAAATTTAPTTTTPTTTPPTVPTTRPAPPVGLAPLTHLPVTSPAVLREPAVVVKIDNVLGAFPQTGVGQADVVYEEMVEGGLTRLAAVFQSNYPPVVGPVRSGRLTDIAIVDDLNHPVLAFAGANGIFLPQLRAQPIQDIDIDNRGDLFVRRGPNAAPHNVYTDPAKDATTDSPAGPPGALFTFHSPAAALTGAGVVAASQVSVGWPQASATWTYGPTTHVWSRIMNAAPDVDRAGRQITATNVIVEPIQYTVAAEGYESGVLTVIPEGHLLGTGPVWILSTGRAVQGTWSRTSLNGPTTYRDSKGQTISLTPGNTWVELVQAGSLPIIK